MPFDLTKFNLIYSERVYKALGVWDINFKENHAPFDVCICKPKTLSIAVIDENGNFTILTAEAWRFQFVPIVEKKEG